MSVEVDTSPTAVTLPRSTAGVHSVPPPPYIDAVDLIQSLDLAQAGSSTNLDSVLSSCSSSSHKPIAIVIPQTSQSKNSPFARCIPIPCPIPANEFLHIIDSLNIAMAPSPPMQVLNLTGEILAAVPMDAVSGAGEGLKAASEVGDYLIRKMRRRYVLGKAQEEVFGPRGYRVEVCKRMAMLGVIGSDEGPIVEEKISMIKKCGRSGRLTIDEKEYIERAIGGLVERGLVRNLVSVGLPLPDKERLNVIDRISAFQVARRQRRELRGERRRSLNRFKLVEAHSVLSGHPPPALPTFLEAGKTSEKEMKPSPLRMPSFRKNVETKERRERKHAAVRGIEVMKSKLQRSRTEYDLQVSSIEDRLKSLRLRGDQVSEIVKAQKELDRIKTEISVKIARTETDILARQSKAKVRIERRLSKLDKTEGKIMKRGWFIVITGSGEPSGKALLDESDDDVRNDSECEEEAEEGGEGEMGSD